MKWCEERRSINEVNTILLEAQLRLQYDESQVESLVNNINQIFHIINYI